MEETNLVPSSNYFRHSPHLCQNRSHISLFTWKVIVLYIPQWRPFPYLWDSSLVSVETFFDTTPPPLSTAIFSSASSSQCSCQRALPGSAPPPPLSSTPHTYPCGCKATSQSQRWYCCTSVWCGSRRCCFLSIRLLVPLLLTRVFLFYDFLHSCSLLCDLHHSLNENFGYYST